MKSKKWISACVFFIICMIITVLGYMYTLKGANGHAMYELALELTKGHQLKQILLSVCIYVYGYIVMKTVKLDKNEYWDAILAYPMGILVWSLLSAIVLIVGIPYRLWVMIGWLAILLCLSIWQIKRNEKCFSVLDLLHNIFYALGIAAIASSGIFMIYMSNDSLYYLVKYGEILAIDGAFTQNVSYWLTWIGAVPATLGALVKFLDLYSIYTIHHMMLISFVLFFIVTIYEKIKKYQTKNNTIIWVFVTTIMLLTTPAFFLLGQWVISNTYFMIYMYIFLYVIYEVQEQRINSEGAYIFLSIISIWLTLSRSESMATMCFLIICASTLKVDKKKLFYYLLLPSSVLQVLYWIKVYLVQGYLFEGMLTVKNVAVMVLAFTGTGLYLLFIGTWFESKIKIDMSVVVIGALILLNLGLFILMPEKGLRGMEVVSYNLANESWGFFPWLVIFFYVVFVNKGLKVNYWDMCWIGYILFNYGICMGKTSVARYGIGDSLNRIICAIVPMIFLAIVVHIRELLIKQK